MIDLFTRGCFLSLSLPLNGYRLTRSKNWIPFDTVIFFEAVGVFLSPFLIYSFSLAFQRTDYTFIFYCLTRYGYIGCCYFFRRHFDEMILILCNFILNWQLVCRFFKQLNFLDLYFCLCLPLSLYIKFRISVFA